MPWRECSVMEERLCFVARLLDGEGMSRACREFGISRKTDYKIWDRYRQGGTEALTDRSRRPVRYANQLPKPIVEAKKTKPHWGARKIRELLVRRLAGDARLPATSTVHAVCDRHGLVKRARQRRRCKAAGTELSRTARPTVVHRFQRRVQAWQRSLLLPSDGHRPSLALPAGLRGPRNDSGRPGRRSLPVACSGNAACQTRSAPTMAPLRQPQRPVQSLQAIGLLAETRDRHRALSKPGHPHQNGVASACI